MKNKFLLFCLFLSVFYFSFIFAQASVMINEVLPNPRSDWNGNNINETYDDEWIELFNPGPDENLKEWKIGDKVKNYSLDKLICSNCFIVLYGSETNLQLNNNNEEIYLYNSNNTLVDFYSYSSSSEDLSFGRCPDGNDSWQQDLTPTPGAANNCSQQSQQDPVIELDYPSEVDCGEEFEIDLEAFNFEDGIYDVKIDIMGEDEENIDGYVWDPNEDKWHSTNNYVDEILDIDNGEGSVTLDFKIEDYEGEAILRTKIRKSGSSSYDQFEDINIDVNCDISEESEIKIIDAPDEARFGESIEVEIEVYRGNTAKYAVYVYVQDNDGIKVSNKISLHFDEKFETNLEIVELILKCKNEQGNYEIIAEGLDELNREQIYLEPCEEEGEEETKKEQTKSESSIEQETTNNYKSVSSNAVLESENFLITKAMPYFLTTISLILVIYLIIKKI